jgi:hypothetical protein
VLGIALRDLHPEYGARSRVAFILEGVLIATLALLLVTVFVVGMVMAQPVASSDVRVIDGDTVALNGSRERVRLVGFNAPETRNAACSTELQLGYQAKHRLLGLVRQGPNDLHLVPCSCPPGTEGTERCNHGRRCGVLSVAGQDVGAMLIAEGLAVPFQCGRRAARRTLAIMALNCSLIGVTLTSASRTTARPPKTKSCADFRVRGKRSRATF